MASLESVLANIPGYGGYAARNQQKREEEFQDVKAVGALQQILEAKQKAQQAAQDRARQEQAREAISRLPQDAKPDDIMSAMRPYVSPEHLYQWTQSEQLKRATADQTKQMAMLRLQRDMERDARQIQDNINKAKTAEEKFHWQQKMDVFKAHIAQRASNIAAGRFDYDVGGGVLDPMPSVPVPEQHGGQTPTQSATPAGLSALMLPPSVPDSDIAAYRSAVSGVPATVNRQVTPQEEQRMQLMGGAQSASVPVRIPASSAPSASDLPPEIARLPRRSQDAYRAQEAQAIPQRAAQIRDDISKEMKPIEEVSQNIVKAKQLLATSSPPADVQLRMLLTDLFNPTRATNILFESNKNFGTLMGRGAGFVSRFFTGQYTDEQRREILQMVTEMEENVINPTKNNIYSKYGGVADSMRVPRSMIGVPDTKRGGSASDEADAYLRGRGPR